MTAKAADALDGVFARERQQEIARIVDANGRARVTELAERFGVSAVTIRKDLLVLESERRVVRTHGGAIAPRGSRPELAFDVRERLQREEKSRIGSRGGGRRRRRREHRARRQHHGPVHRPSPQGPRGLARADRGDEQHPDRRRSWPATRASPS